MTVNELTADLGLRLIAGDGATEVTWAHSSDLTDPTPFLEPGNLLLTTGSQFTARAGPEELADYVARLAHVGVAALGFGAEVVRETPVDLSAACQEHGLVAVEVPYRVPFLAVARHLAEARTKQAYARDLWALEAQRALSLAALRASRESAVLDELGRQLEAPVVLLDAGGAVVAEHGRRRLSPTELAAVEDRAAPLLRSGRRTAATVDLPAGTVSLQTLGRGEELRGVLAVAPVTALDRAARSVVTVAIALVEFAAADQARRWEVRQALDGQVLRLCTADRDAAQAVLEAAERRLPAPPLALVLARGVQPGDEVDQRLAGMAEKADGLVCCRWQGHLLVVTTRRRGQAWAEVLSATHTAVVRVAAPGWQGVPSALQRAAVALRDRAFGDPPGEVPESALWGLLSREELAPVAHQRLAVLGEGAPGREWRRLLAVWLRHNGAWEPAAAELGRHRHTLKGQVTTAGKLLGLDLRTFAGRAELWALLTAAED